MGEIVVHRKIVRWGNGFGIRLTKSDLERLGIRASEPAEVVIRTERRGLDLSALPTFRLGGDASIHHDAILGEGLDADL